uniref:Uncharacterized protein n=1 Tax=virus sp. ctkyY8 TaxID=2827995 RepID=A0A8S5REL5_9VIRU|nr:MAG TPA: hypothetical protein [virus sp. ctkyY8]
MIYADKEFIKIFDSSFGKIIHIFNEIFIYCRCNIFHISFRNSKKSVTSLNNARIFIFFRNI